MKAKIAHSIELEQLIDKLIQLVGDNIEPLNNAAELLKVSHDLLKLEKDASAGYVVELIDRVRRKLAEVDDYLNEVNSLLGGYIANVLESEEEQSEQTLEEPVPPPVEEPASESTKYWDPTTRTLVDKSPSQGPRYK